MIKKVKEGYRVVSEKKGRNLGTDKTKDEAKERLRQVEFFKHKKAKSGMKK
jgi:ribosomal protein S4E